jgi:hypothetical protein
MQYVLGNMLNGGGGLNADGLALDLQFAADKTLTARRGPTPTFIRSSGDNGGTTYFGPLVDFDEATAFSTTGIFNGRASWFKSYEGTDITISYTGARWRAVTVDNGDEVTYLAAPGSEWRPDQADWSGEAFSVTTSSTFGIVKAANNEPRFDHDPVTLACKGLLIEEGRTNLYQQSEVFNDSFWTKTRSSISSNATTAPDGTLTADKLVEDTTASNTHTIQSTVTPPATAHTLSVFAKKGERTWIVLRLGGTNTFFNLDDGTIAAGSVNSPTITNFGNGWYRCAVTSSLGTQGQFWLATNSTTTSYTGDGTSGLFLWGAQLEAGSFATSYIPTTTGTLARSADVCSIANTASFWNSDQFTLFGNANFPNPAHDAYAANFSITNGFFGVRRPNTNTAAAIIRSSGVNADISLGTFVTGTMRMAVAHSSGQQAAAFNGGSATQTSSAFSPSLNPALNIGYSGTAGYINGHIAAIRYYKKRLPNAKLVTLTT